MRGLRGMCDGHPTCKVNFTAEMGTLLSGGYQETKELALRDSIFDFDQRVGPENMFQVFSCEA